MYVATASGGLWKTTNNGTTWNAVFDHEAIVVLGDVAVAPSNPDVVWVGTGEANARNSVAWGDGVYRCSLMEENLEECRPQGFASHRPHADPIPRIPTRSMSRLCGTFGVEQRAAVFTRPPMGSKTWNQVKFLDEETGFIDPGDGSRRPGHPLCGCLSRPARCLFRRLSDRAVRSARGSVLDQRRGGKTWKKLSNGLPEGADQAAVDSTFIDARSAGCLRGRADEKTRAARETEFGQAQKPNNDAATGRRSSGSDDRGETWRSS